MAGLKSLRTKKFYTERNLEDAIELFEKSGSKIDENNVIKYRERLNGITKEITKFLMKEFAKGLGL